MTGQPIAPQAQRPQSFHQAAHMMHSYSHSPLARSTTDLSEVTHEYEPDVDADGFRHPGNHHAEISGEYSPGSTLRPQSAKIGGRSAPKSSKFRPGRPTAEEPSKPNSFTFEHEPDVDAEGFRHHHENMSSPALRALQDVVVPLDPRAGRIVITPSPSIKPNYSPYRHDDDIPNRSIEDLQDPEELHSNASMIYGINEARASQHSVPNWQEGEAAAFIEEASHGDLHPPTVPARPVAKKLPIEPTGEVMAPVGNIAGDTDEVGPTRNMEESEMPGIAGAYTKDGEGSAGLAFDANSGASKAEGDIEVQEEGTIAPPDMSASTETIKGRRMSSLASDIERPGRPRAPTPGPVEDVKLPSEQPLSQDGTAMQRSESVKDERPEWLRAAEMMANNQYDKLAEEGLITNEIASNESIDFASAARATLARDNKIERGTSYPSFMEMEAADEANHVSKETETSEGIARQGVSNLPEKDLGGANPPAGSKAREDKFALETETPSFKAKDNVEPATAAKFLGLSSGAAAGASVPAAALMTSERDLKSGSAGETKIAEPVPSGAKMPEDVIHNADAHLPAVPRTRPARRSTHEEEHAPARDSDLPAKQPSIPPRPQSDASASKESVSTGKSGPAVPRRPASTASNTSAKESPTVPARPSRAGTIPKETAEIKAPIPVKPSVPARPAVGKLAGSSKFAFASALEAKLKGGPPVPKKKEESEEREIVSQEPTKPLGDARKGRARGPQKRKPASAVVAPVEDEQTTQQKIETLMASPTCEKGEFFISRFGVEMRSMSIQTGVIKIESPAGKVTVMQGAGTEYAGQNVVVDTPTAKPHAISKQEVTINVAPSASLQPASQSAGAQVHEESSLLHDATKLEESKENDSSVPPTFVDSAAGEDGESPGQGDGAIDESVDKIRDELEVEP